MTSTTLRDPIDRDVSDDVFRRMHGGKDAGIDYLGDEQTRFLLLNSERARDGVAPRDLYGDHRARVEAEGALRAATRILRDDFDLVATIDDLEAQKDAFVDFFKLESRAKDVKKSQDFRREVGAAGTRARDRLREGRRRRDAHEGAEGQVRTEQRPGQAALPDRG